MCWNRLRSSSLILAICAALLDRGWGTAGETSMRVGHSRTTHHLQGVVGMAEQVSVGLCSGEKVGGLRVAIASFNAA